MNGNYLEEMIFRVLDLMGLSDLAENQPDFRSLKGRET